MQTDKPYICRRLPGLVGLCFLVSALSVTKLQAEGKVIQTFTPPYAEPIVANHTQNSVNPRTPLSKESRAVLNQTGLLSSYQSDPAAALNTLLADAGGSDAAAKRTAAIEICLKIGKKQKEAREAAGYFITGADFANDGLGSGTGAQEARTNWLNLYNESCGKAAEALASMEAPFSSGPIAGPLKQYQVSHRTAEEMLLDIRFFDSLVPALDLKFRNIEMERFTRDGAGAAMVAHYARTEERYRENSFLGPRGLMMPVNVVLEFGEGGSVTLLARDLHLVNSAVVGGRNRPLSADFTAPLAALLDNIPKRDLGWQGMLHPDDYEDIMGLYQLEPFRSDQIPVIFVHGLMSSPAVWVSAMNQLRSDPKLRAKYQVLAFYYPTGFPIPYNAHSLRTRLKEFQQTYDPGRSNPNMRNMIMIGHSMGGQLTNSQIRTSGDSYTKRLFDRPIAELEGVTEDQKRAFRKLLLYEANPDITRAVFLASPHRGSGLATSSLGKLGHNLIKMPSRLLAYVPDPDVQGLTPVGEEVILSRPDSIHSLAPNSPGLLAILDQPVREGVVIHSVIANHKLKEPLEKSSDLVVPYWSSRLDYAASEVIVNATHTTICENSEAIEEVRRLLYLHGGLN